MKIVKISFLIIILYLSLIVFLYVFQRNLVYFPYQDRNKPQDVGAIGFNEIFYPTHDGIRLKAWYRPPPQVTPDAKVMMLFHGNSDVISNWAKRAVAYADLGIGVLLVEYRGYGGNDGTPTEMDLLEDARYAIKWLESNGIAKENLIFYGHSLGTGVATAMAAEFPPRALLLEAPYNAVVEVAAIRFPIVPVQMLMHDQFPSGDRIQKVSAPVTIVHGDRDMVIPLSQGQKLAQNVRAPLDFHIIKGGGHVDLYEHGAFDIYKKTILAVD